MIEVVDVEFRAGLHRGGLSVRLWNTVEKETKTIILPQYMVDNLKRLTGYKDPHVDQEKLEDYLNWFLQGVLDEGGLTWKT